MSLAVSHRPPKSQTQCRRSSSPIVPQQTIVPVLGSDPRYQVLYELQLVNTLGRPADLRSVEVLDASNGRSLLTLSAAEIVKGDYLHTLNRQLATSTSVAPFEGLGNHGDHNVAFRSPGDGNPDLRNGELRSDQDHLHDALCSLGLSLLLEGARAFRTLRRTWVVAGPGAVVFPTSG
jgi:hypothetical protein